MSKKAVSCFITRLSTTLFLSLAGFNAYANDESLLLEGGDAALLSTINTFHVKAIDQVADGCLANPTALRAAMEAALKQKGFQLADRVGSKAQGIVINTLGYQLTPAPTCAVRLKVYIELPLIATVPYARQNPSGETTLLVHNYDVREELLTGPKSDMQARLEHAIQEAANSAATDITRARDTIFTKFPAIKEEFENQAM